jgi:DNA-directed RNA polymerase specialized sigma subunit
MQNDPRVERIEQILATGDPLQRARLASDLITDYQLRIAELSGIRQAAIEDAYSSGLTVTEIGQHLGLTTGRISQLRNPKGREVHG